MSRVKAYVQINNAPSKLYKYTIVRRSDDGKLWYWGTYDDRDRAKMAQAELGDAILVEVME